MIMILYYAEESYTGNYWYDVHVCAMLSIYIVRTIYSFVVLESYRYRQVQVRYMYLEIQEPIIGFFGMKRSTTEN